MSHLIVSLRYTALRHQADRAFKRFKPSEVRRAAGETLQAANIRCLHEKFHYFGKSGLPKASTRQLWKPFKKMDGSYNG